MYSCHCLSNLAPLSRSPLDATTPNTTDRLRVISLLPLTRTRIFNRAQPSQCIAWHQQSCATRTRPCGDFRDLEKMSQMISSLVHALLCHAANVTSCNFLLKKGTTIHFVPLSTTLSENTFYTSAFSDYSLIASSQGLILLSTAESISAMASGTADELRLLCDILIY